VKRTILSALSALAILSVAHGQAAAQGKRVAITSFGEHPALQLVIDGFKASMKERGYVEGRDVTITFTHVNWERNLIPQMLTKVASERPDVVVTITTPVTQTAVRALQDPAIPVVFAAVQDPVVAGVVPAWDKAGPNMTGASNLVDMDGSLKFIRELMPNAKRIGVPYNPGDDADNALREKLVAAAPKYNFELVLVGIDNANDIPQRLQTFAGKVDAVYVFPSNLFQPATAQIAAITTRLGIPAFNGLPAPVQKHEMLASYSVDWPRIGASAAGIVERLFKGEKVSAIKPTVPTPAEHSVVVSQQQLDRWKIKLPEPYASCAACIVK
jgi:putative tryptophan/tyrosine transport system substrate-binding protein